MTNDSPFQEGNVLISLRADSSQKVSFALQQNGFPVVRDVIIKNDGDFSLENVRLDVSALPQFFKPFSCSLPDIHERTSYTLDTLDLTIEHGQLPDLSKLLTELIGTPAHFLDKAFGHLRRSRRSLGRATISHQRCLPEGR